MPSPSAWFDEAQADSVAMLCPVSPKRIARCPAAAFAISIGTMNGDTRFGPFSSSTRCCCSSVWIPPMPVAKITPPRSDTISGVPASVQARDAAEIA